MKNRYNRKQLRKMAKDLNSRKKQPWTWPERHEVTTMDGKTFEVRL